MLPLRWNKCRNVIDTNNGNERNSMLKFPEIIKKIHKFPISANGPEDLTDIKLAADWKNLI